MAATRRGARDLAALTVLALLWTGPRHAYEMHRIVIQTHKDFVTGLPRSLYHAVDRLERGAFVVPVETTREGNRPERTVYQLTDEGHAELRSRLCLLLERPDPDGELFAAAMSFVGCLPPNQVRECLVARAAALEGELAGLQSHLDHSRLPRLVLLEGEYRRAVQRAELDWVRSLVADLDSGAVGWSDDPCELGAHIPGGVRRTDPP